MMQFCKYFQLMLEYLKRQQLKKAKLMTKEKVIPPSEHWQGLVPTETAVNICILTLLRRGERKVQLLSSTLPVPVDGEPLES
jgi:hypothetical protein